MLRHLHFLHTFRNFITSLRFYRIPFLFFHLFVLSPFFIPLISFLYLSSLPSPAGLSHHFQIQFPRHFLSFLAVASLFSVEALRHIILFKISRTDDCRKKVTFFPQNRVTGCKALYGNCYIFCREVCESNSLVSVGF